MPEANSTWDLELPSLHKTFAGLFMFGNIVTPQDLGCEDTMSMYCHHYNAVTCENAMKPVKVTSGKGVYNFDDVDRIVEWACKSKIAIVGHTLIWHNQSAPWLNKDADGKPLKRCAARANMEDFIKTYAGRYSGKIHSWDVINEAFRDSDQALASGWRDQLRRMSDNPRATSDWYLAYENGADKAAGESGADYGFDAFYFARKYDPHALLYYNEYNEETPAKRDAITQMVCDINACWKNHADYDGRPLIEGIGMQCHYNHKDMNLANTRAALECFKKTGAKIAVTELDITFGSADEPTTLAADESRVQAASFGDLFRLLMEFSGSIERVTMWGKNDDQSWRAWGKPTLFHGSKRAKEAFHAVTAAGLGKKLNVDCVCKNRDCPRHGDCEACEAAHGARGNLPACKREGV